MNIGDNHTQTQNTAKKETRSALGTAEEGRKEGNATYRLSFKKVQSTTDTEVRN